jgi:uncharacterized protein (DUF2062 family)
MKPLAVRVRFRREDPMRWARHIADLHRPRRSLSHAERVFRKRIRRFERLNGRTLAIA